MVGSEQERSGRLCSPTPPKSDGEARAKSSPSSSFPPRGSPSRTPESLAKELLQSASKLKELPREEQEGLLSRIDSLLWEGLKGVSSSNLGAPMEKAQGKIEDLREWLLEQLGVLSGYSSPVSAIPFPALEELPEEEQAEEELAQEEQSETIIAF